MNRTVLKILCIVSGILFAVFTAVLVICAVQASKAVDAASIGIIGGADGPTAIFITQKAITTPLFYTVISTFLLFIGTGLTLLLGKKPKKLRRKYP